MGNEQSAVMFSPLAEWLFRLIPLLIAVASFIFTMITRYENRRKLTIRWTSELVSKSSSSIGDPSIVIGIHNTGKRMVTLVADSYYILVAQKEYYIKEFFPQILGRADYPGLLHEGDSFKIAIKLTDFIGRVLEPETVIVKGDIVPIRIRFKDVENKLYESKALYSITGFGLLEKDNMYGKRVRAAKESRKRIRDRHSDAKSEEIQGHDESNHA